MLCCLLAEMPRMALLQDQIECCLCCCCIHLAPTSTQCTGNQTWVVIFLQALTTALWYHINLWTASNSILNKGKYGHDVVNVKSFWSYVVQTAPWLHFLTRHSPNCIKRQQGHWYKATTPKITSRHQRCDPCCHSDHNRFCVILYTVLDMTNANSPESVGRTCFTKWFICIPDRIRWCRIYGMAQNASEW